jgi:hypothetical protein
MIGNEMVSSEDFIRIVYCQGNRTGRFATDTKDALDE